MAASASPVPDAGRTTKAGERPQSIGHQDALDGLRLVAAFAVLCYHVAGFTGDMSHDSETARLLSRGEIGVPLFYALSGLLLYRPWVKATLLGSPGPAVASYLWRRALRIFPAYWIVAVVAMLTLDLHLARDQWDWTEMFLLVHIYDFHPWWPSDAIGPRGLAQVWSLAVEVSFYVLLPLIAAALSWIACRRTVGVDGRAKRLLCGIAIMSAISFGYVVLTFHPLRPVLQTWLPRYLCWFGAGMAVSVLSVWAQAASPGGLRVRRLCHTIGRSPGICLIIAAIAYAVAATSITGPLTSGVMSLAQMETRLGLYLVVAFFLVAPVGFQSRAPSLVNSLLGNPLMRFLGRISYAIFLWQFLVLYAFYNVTHRAYFSGGFWWVLAVSVFGTVVVATLSFYLVEKPAQRLRSMFDDPVRPAGPQDSVPEDKALRAAELKETRDVQPSPVHHQDPEPDTPPPA